MIINIRSRTPTRDIETYGGERQVMITGPTEVEMEIVCDGEEAREIVQRLQGMPGLPINTPSGESVAEALAKLDPHFARRIDID